MKPPAKRKVRWAISEEYTDSWVKYKKDDLKIRERLTEFNTCKRAIPPRRLPDQMHDHKLKGQLDGIRECHLAKNILLLYTHDSDLVNLLLVCRHADLYGPKGKALSQKLKKMLAISK